MSIFYRLMINIQVVYSPDWTRMSGSKCTERKIFGKVQASNPPIWILNFETCIANLVSSILTLCVCGGGGYAPHSHPHLSDIVNQNRWRPNGQHRFLIEKKWLFKLFWSIIWKVVSYQTRNYLFCNWITPWNSELNILCESFFLIWIFFL